MDPRAGVTLVALSDAPRNAATAPAQDHEARPPLRRPLHAPRLPLPKNVDPGSAGARRRGTTGGHAGARAASRGREAEPLGLERILQDFGLRGPEVVYVGDNVKKDMPVARACGAIGVWAEYGTYVSAEYRERLEVISAPSGRGATAADEGQERWPLAISSFTQVRDVVQGSRWTACAGGEAARDAQAQEERVTLLVKHQGPGRAAGPGGRRLQRDWAGDCRGLPRAGDEGRHSLSFTPGGGPGPGRPLSGKRLRGAG